MLKLNSKRNYAVESPEDKVYELYEKFMSLITSKQIIEAKNKPKTEQQITNALFEKLDIIADMLDAKTIDISNIFWVLKRISVSPTRKFQVWNVNDMIIVFSKNVVWYVYGNALFFEGEVKVTSVVWDENEKSILLTLFYIVYHEYENYEVSFEKSRSLNNDTEQDEEHKKMPKEAEEYKLYVRTKSKKIEVTTEPQVLYRCQLEVCDPKNAHDECFLISKKCKNADYIEVENIGYGVASVEYYLRMESAFLFEYKNEDFFDIEGDVRIEIDKMQEKIRVCANDTSKLILKFGKGKKFILRPMDKIGSGEDPILRCDDEQEEEWDVWDAMEW